MAKHHLVMYASKSKVEHFYSELYGDVDEISIEKGQSVSGSTEGKLRALIANLSSNVSGEVTRSEIHNINFDTHIKKAKRIANNLISDETLPNVSNQDLKNVELNRLYRFSCPLLTKPIDSDVSQDDPIEVTARLAEFGFQGITSLENWGSRSHILQSIKASKHDEAYPYQGIMWPRSIQTESSIGVPMVHVDYLLICAPKTELANKWYDDTVPNQRIDTS